MTEPFIRKVFTKIGPGTRRPFYKQNNKYLPHLGKNVLYVGTDSGIVRRKVN